MASIDKFVFMVDSVKEDLRVNGEFDGFSDKEWAFVEEVLMSDNAEVFLGLLSRARERGVCAGIDEERSNSFARD